MKPLAEIYLSRAETDLVGARVLFEVSKSNELQQQSFKLEKDFTFYSLAIAHSYYSIFYSAKAMLANTGIKTYPPNEHWKTYDIFEKHFVRTGKLDTELLEIYKDTAVKAEALLGIFFIEKKKRGKFTYKKLPQANMGPASKSLENASLFFKSIGTILRIKKTESR